MNYLPDFKGKLQIEVKMKGCVLVIGLRKACYQAAMDLGYDVVLWSDGPLNKGRRKGLLGWIEILYKDCQSHLTQGVKSELAKFPIERVIANTEESVVLGARVRKHLGIEHLAVDVTERFHNKFIMKNHAKKLEVPITNYELIDADTDLNTVANKLNYPVVIKPVDESGAQDVKLANNLQELEAYAAPGLLAESFVKGSEVSVETFIKNGEPIFHNMTEYLHQWKKSVVPAQIDPDLYEKIIEINDKVIKGFGVDRGMTHSEFYLTENGPVFGEIAIRPPGGYYMNLISQVYKFDAWKTYVKLSCKDDNYEINHKPHSVGGVYMLHPGKGRIKEIKGVEDIKSHIPGIFDLSIRKKIGDLVLEHENTSNEVGHVLFCSATRQDFDNDLKFIEDHLIFEMES